MIKDKLYSTYLDAIRDKVAERRVIELSGIPPLSFKAKGKPLTAWSITGNTVQNGTPTPENPVEVFGCGDRTGNLADVIRGKVPRVSDGSLVTFEGLTTEYVPFHTGDILSVSFDKPASAKRFYAFYYSGDTLLITKDLAYGTSISSYGVPEAVDRIRIRIDYSGVEVSNVMLNLGSTPLPYEPYGYKIPVVTKSDGAEPITTPIYLPTPLYSGEVMRSDGTITRSDGTTETFTAPQIPTLNGTTVIDVDTAVKPESMTIKYKAV